MTLYGGSLKPHLLHDFHYIVVNKTIWMHLKSWYGATNTIERQIRHDNDRGKFLDKNFDLTLCQDDD